MAVFTVHGALTSASGDGELRRAVRAAVDEGARHLVINLEEVVDIDSSGVAELASAHITTNNRGGTLRLSLGPFTTSEEIDAALDALRSLVGSV